MAQGRKLWPVVAVLAIGVVIYSLSSPGEPRIDRAGPKDPAGLSKWMKCARLSPLTRHGAYSCDGTAR